MAAPALVSSHQLPSSDTSSFLATLSFTSLRNRRKRNVSEKSFKGEIYEYGAKRHVDGGKGGYMWCPCIDAF